ncbi:hypothetical protein GF339_08790 [candidate division KSB3 bacterium]|jgi:hypothetical protein|uniref:Uncharacterized protein n=1 Tax=candidate division KSB3 bacterium TaxID=2044937 RepID=A0A9D5JVG4_9BACT|nr:hypothetical protein [candidate division KSB3 bacterium]MBD3324667.1 hypothetical protein [candidate division KSB3 bacterium]
MNIENFTELEKRLAEYRQNSENAEKIALQKLQNYPKPEQDLSPVEVLRRELLRHHTRTLLLKEIEQWMAELKEKQPGA